MSERVEIRYEINTKEFSEKSRQIEGDLSKSSSAIAGHIEPVEKSVKQSATSYIEAGNDLKSIIEIQKSAIKDLERQYKQASTQVRRLPAGRQKDAQKGELNSIEREIKAEKNALNELAVAKKEVDAASVSLRTQLANVRDEMGKLGQEGKHESARYRELETEMGRLGLQYRRLHEHQKLLSRGGSSLTGFVSGMQALSGAADVTTEAVGLFVDKNEDMAKIQTKIQGVMAISMGLMQVSNVKLRAPGAKSDKGAIEVAEPRLIEYKAEFELLTGASAGKGKGDAALDQESKLYEDRIKQSRDFQNRLVELSYETEQARVDAMEEGYAKSAAQAELEHRKQLTSIELWNREIQDKIVDEQRSIFMASGGKEASFVFNPDDLDSLEDMAALNEGVRARIAVSDREYERSQKKLLDDLKNQWSGWADEHEKIELEITKTREKAIKDRAALSQALETGNISDADHQAGTEVIDKGERTDLSRLNAAKIRLSKEWVQVFKDIEILSRQEVNELIDSINEQLENSELKPADVSALNAQLALLKDWNIPSNPFAAFYDGIKKVKKATEEVEAAQIKLQQATGTTNETEARKALAEADIKQRIAEHTVLKAAQGSMQKTASMANAMAGLLSTLGMESQTLNAALGALDHLATMDLTKPFSIVTGSIGAISSLFGGFFGKKDRSREKDIRRIQKQVDNLRKAYRELSREIDKSFSSQAAVKIKEQQENLNQQKNLIQDQIDRENGKKKKDKGRIGQWEGELEEIDEQLKDLEESARDAIFGADLNSAINDFATAYMEAWSSGENRAKSQKDVVKEMIKGIISEMMKSDIAAAVEQMRKRIEEMMSDDHLSDQELEEIARMGDDMGGIMDKRSEMYEKWMQTMGIDNDKSITGAIRGTIATEQSVSELGGIFRGQWDSLKQIELSITGSVAQVASIVRSNLIIEFNTRRTAENTEAMTIQLDEIGRDLKKIDKNTKPESYAR